MSTRVFLVDDEEPITRSLKRELSEWGDENSISFSSYTNPEEALNALKSTPDVFLIISDLRMPEMSGSDLLLEVHRLYPDIITILLTGYSEVEEIMKAIKAGIFSYILKPWDPQYLLAEVHKAFDLFRIKQERRQYIEMLNEELKWGGELQKKLLVRELPSAEGIEFSVEYHPLPKLYCGGDYYDVIPLAGETFLVLLGDVAGHGLKAAFITTILKTVIYSGYIRDHREDKMFSPARFLFWLNSRISLELKQFPDMLITFVALVVSKKRVVFSNAGQSQFFLIRNGRFFPVYEQGICLNITDRPVYKNRGFTLEEGDTLYLFTDGLIEITEDKTALSVDETGALLADAATRKLSVKQTIDLFKHSSSDNSFSDDVTLLQVRILP